MRSRFVKVAVVAGGYVAAFLIASAVVAVRVAVTSGPVAQASSGMYAFGDAFLFVGVFGVCRSRAHGRGALLPPTLSSLLDHDLGAGCAVAVTGIAAAILFAVGRNATPSPLATWAGFSVLRILVAPLLALTFLVCTVFSPHRSPRLAFLAATLMEAAVSAYGGLVWFVPMLFQRP